MCIQSGTTGRSSGGSCPGRQPVRAAKTSLDLSDIRYNNSPYNLPRRHSQGTRAIALLFLEPRDQMGFDGRRQVSAALPPRNKPLPITQKADRARGPVWTDAENLAPHPDSIPGPSSP